MDDRIFMGEAMPVMHALKQHVAFEKLGIDALTGDMGMLIADATKEYISKPSPYAISRIRLRTY